MLGSATGEVLDLLPARDSGGNDLHVASCRPHRRYEAPIGDGHRKVIVFFFKAEGTCHAAAARIDFTDLKAGGFQHGNGRRRSDQSFLMAVTVQQRLAT